MKLITVAGAPGAGKSVVAAQIYYSLYLLDAPEPRYVPEYAHKYFGQGYKINTLDSQLEVTKAQLSLENEEISTGGSTIVCDSALWLGEIYLKHMICKHTSDMIEAQEKLMRYEDSLSPLRDRYDLVFFVPLTKNCDQLNDFRIHNYEQSKEIEDSIRAYATAYNIPMVELPESYVMREAVVRTTLGNFIKNNE